MITTAKIVAYDGSELTVMPQTPIERELLQKQVEDIEIRLNDGRTLSAIQREKICGICNDIAAWYADDPLIMRKELTAWFCEISGDDEFSLSPKKDNCVDMTTARLFLDYLIRFCLEHNVPTRKPLSSCAEDIGRYLYHCLEFRKCAICGKDAEVHHVTGSKIGMGGNRNEVHHLGRECVALCRIHHDEAHHLESDFFEKWHIYGIPLDEYLCKILELKE